MLKSSALAVVFTLLAGSAVADDDHARARAALEAGKILPLATIVAAAEKRVGGSVLDVELEDEDDGSRGRRHGRGYRDGAAFIYEVKVLAPDGRIVKLEYDAETGVLLRERRRP